MFVETSYSTLGELDGVLPTIIGAGSSIGGGVIGGLIGGAAGGPIGAGIGLLGSLIASIFGQHAARVQREDEISGAWAASGPQAIDQVMSMYRSGQISGRDAAQGLDQIEMQFRQMTQPITKYKGHFGSFPDPNAARPGDECNWACGTSWDLHQQIIGLKSQIDTSSGGGIGGASLGGIDPVVLIGLGVLAFMLMK